MTTVSRSTTDTEAGANRLITATVVGVAAAFAGVALFGGGSDASNAAGIQEAPSGYAFQVGDPGVGEPAPAIQAAATTGEFDLAAYRGERVLLYFQEGLMCQPCWDQLTELEARWDEVEALGVNALASVTTDGLSGLEQKVAIEGISTPVVADPERAISERYTTLDYGMMGGSHNGHTFIVVGPDGTIEWRADYGGAPDYTMYLPVDAVLKDLEAGLEGSA
ncbi:MAG: peroxiredoxin family protein [Actinobacteria bacterium]|nr:peroxiredoxin family protein [Actinomycetota bacterium]